MISALRAHWWLGRRLLRERSQRYGLVALFACSALTGLLLVGLCSVPGTLEASRTVEAARTVTDTGRTTGVLASTTLWDWRGQDRVTMLRIGVDEGSDPRADKLPGVSRSPGPGQAWLSPQLLKDLQTDSALRPAFPQQVLGTIDPAALTSATERVAYLGLDPAKLRSMGVTPTQRVGAEQPETRGLPATVSALAVVVVVIFVGLPLAGLFIAAYGVLAGTRRKQVTLLIALGLTPARARVTAAADGLLVGVAGAATSWLLFAIVTHAFTSVPFTPARWVAGRPALTVAGCVLSLIAPLVAAAWSARRGAAAPKRRQTRVTDQRRGSRTDRFAIVAALVGVLAVTASARLRVDASAVATTAVVAAVALLLLSLPRAVLVLQRRRGRALLAGPATGTELIVGARLARTAPRAARSTALLVPVFLVTLSVAPLLSQVAPRDSLTARTNQQLGRVVSFVTPVPDERTQQRIAALPGVLAVAAPSRRQPTFYTFDCASFRRLLDRESCAQPVTALSMPGRLSAGWPYTADWTFTTTQAPTPSAEQSTDPDAPLIVLARDTESYWLIAAAIRGLDPLANTDANTGGLIGGSDQRYLLMQRWLQAGAILLLISAGFLAVLSARTDAAEMARTRRGLNTLGVSTPALRRAMAAELATRSVVTWLAALLSGAAVTIAARGWSNTDTIGPLWVLAASAALTLTLTGAALVSLTTHPDPAHGHNAEDAYHRL